MTRNNEAIKEAFEIYKEVIDKMLESMPKQSELFANLMKLNEKHLIENLDKALVLFKENTQGNRK